MLANRLRELRDRKGLTQAEAAALFDVHLVTYNHWENGKGELNTKRLEQAAEIFGVHPAEILIDLDRPGLGEPEAAPFAAGSDDDGAITRAVRALSAGRNAADPWVLKTRALESEGYLPGDVVIVDLNEAPKVGDVVCAQVFGPEGRAETVFRLWQPPYLIGTGREARQPLRVGEDAVMLKGVVVASFRPRQGR